MKTTILLLFLAITTANAAPRLQDYLTTVTKASERGKKTITVTVIQHKSGEFKLKVETGDPRRVYEVSIPAGNGVIKRDYQVLNNWKTTLYANGRQIDQETAMRKTGRSGAR
jgi:hypothetical protein